MAPNPGKTLHQTTLEGFVSSRAADSSSSRQSSALATPQHPTSGNASGSKRRVIPDNAPTEEVGSDSSGLEAIRFESVTRQSRSGPQRAIVLSDGEDNPIQAGSPSSEPADTEPPSPRKARTVFGSVTRPRSTFAANRVPSTPPSSGASSPLTQSSDEDQGEIPLPSYKSKGKLVIESDEEDAPPKKRVKLALKRFNAEEEEMKELRDEIDPGLIIESKTRARTGTKRAAFAKHLEQLKRKRLYKSSLSPPRKDESEEDGSEVGGEEDDSSTPFNHARPYNASLDEGLDDRDAAGDEGDDFIVEDDQDGVEVDLPDAFNMSSHQDAAHHFKVVCQLFVHLIVSAGDDGEARQKLLETSYFRTALNALRRSLDSTRDSLVASSVWWPEFRRNLESRPNLSISRLREAMSGCDACHMRSRISTLQAHLTGSRWAGLGQGQAAHTDEDGLDEDGELIYHVGRFCASRMQVYHDFAHWEERLYYALEAQIALLRPEEEASSRTRPARTFRHADEPRDLGNADDIMDWLDKKGVTNFEWLQLKQVMESATGLQSMNDEDTLG